MVVSVTPAWPPRREVMTEESQPVLLNTESTPGEGEMERVHLPYLLYYYVTVSEQNVK